MKAPDIFIIIPAKSGRMYYIRPYDIVSLIDDKGLGVEVSYKAGPDVYTFKTMLTATEVHERIIELESQSFTFTFGEDND